MVAPNGARKTHQDHPNLPVSIAETVQEAVRCQAAGATVLHAHVRGRHGEHVLDPVRYRQLIRAMENHVPGMLLQMTTEAVGLYSSVQQTECVYAVQPRLISMAVREIAPVGANTALASKFYRWTCQHHVHVQHIVYDDKDLARLIELQNHGVIPGGRLCVLFVLGRYLQSRESRPADIKPFLAVKGDVPMDWFVCAFGSREHDCALEAIEAGGHARIGFENNLLRPDGSRADYTADLVTALKAAMEMRGILVADFWETQQILGLSDKPLLRKSPLPH